MHETDLALELVTLAREQMLLHGAKRVTRVGLKVGALSCVASEALHFAFQEASTNTELEGAELIITSVAATARCVQHGVIQLELGRGLVCPLCLGRTELLSGEELELDTLELEDL
jgi:hydrogenase nickel incorporation protein HypA/HybF